ncbi:MAG: alpha/beta fold hydrolase [Stappiaceae bacterium]
MESHQLYVDGVLTTVEPQVFDLLKLFAENAGALISHDQLIETIWAGRIVSDSAISARISAARSAIGDDGTRQQVIKTVPKRGFRFLAEVSANSGNPGTETKVATEPPAERAQRIQFCCSADGTQIASAVTGSGYPLVRAGHWLTHLEYDWHSPVWRPFLNKLGSLCSVVRYDQRGNGLSDWDVEDYSLKAFVEDLEAVVDNAAVDKFALYGTSQGAPIAIAYAAKHPDRVSHLVLHGGYQRGRFLRHSQEEREQGEAILTLIRHGWGKPQNAFIQAFASMFIPDGSKEQIESLSELQRRTTSPENAANLRLAVDKFDVSHLLDKLQVPTLVFHARGDSVHPLDQGRKLASGIAGAQFVMLDSRNHVILESEPAWRTLFSEIDRFLAQSSP